MRRTYLTAAAFAIVSALSAAPAYAGYGAFAVDDKAHKFGYSTNQPDQQHADQLALKNCKSDNCKLVFPVGPKQCGAFATTSDGNAWGGAVRPTRDAAQSAAAADCEKRASGKCAVKQAACNR
jgi:hypothetical protein